MPKTVTVYRHGSAKQPILVARWCSSFLCRLRGLMFRRQLPGGIGLVLVEGHEGITNTSIHMFAVPFEIGVLWVNNANEVVDKILARPWRIYAPSKPARFIVEGSPSIVEEVSIGERLEFREEDAA